MYKRLYGLETLFLLNLVLLALILQFHVHPSLTSTPIRLVVDLAPSLTVQRVRFISSVKHVISTVDGFLLPFSVSTVLTLLQDASNV